MFNFFRSRKAQDRKAANANEDDGSEWVEPPFNPSFEPMLDLLKQYKPDDFAAPASIGGGQETESGAIQMPYYIDTPAQMAFREAASVWMRPGMDYPAWMRTERGEQMMAGKPGSIESASKEELGALLTATIRGDRFCDGVVAGFCQSGAAWRMLKRVEALCNEERGQDAGEK